MDNRVKILVCEDDPDHRFLMMEALEENRSNTDFLEAESGAECLDILKREQPEVLILDYRLGDMDGLEILGAIQTMPRQPAVLLVTSQGDEKIAVQAMKMGARDYLVKDTALNFIHHLPHSINQALKEISLEWDRSIAQQQLAESEELNRTIFNQMSEAIIYADRDDTILHLNSLALDLIDTSYGKARKMKLLDPQFTSLFPGLTLLVSRLKSNEDMSFLEDEFTIGEKILTMRATPVLGSEGQYRGVILNLTDISERRREEMEQLEAINRTVFALAKAVEFRDPYTSGHAANVAFIAQSIADLMGWDSKRVMGLRLAGELHDIGKIAIPAEILTKPSRLSPLEIAMLREHPEKGFEILKDIKFPFPVAEAVFQHHEMLDGSGYPRHIGGDGIIPEARILAIADVLDAITAHRPYRSGLGIDSAVAHLTKGRNILFDPTVVDAALALIDRSEKKPFWKIQLARSTEMKELRNQ
ncbi:response regulator [bacterium]|nr:response regulator [candidate division CSSED10-310 bacterium]